MQLAKFKLIKTWTCSIARFVAEKMGGPVERGQLSNFGWELPLSQIKFELKCNVIPLGKIKCGIHVHRALLFKVWSSNTLLTIFKIRIAKLH